jgi:hypothetical protein
MHSSRLLMTKSSLNSALLDLQAIAGLIKILRSGAWLTARGAVDRAGAACGFRNPIDFSNIYIYKARRRAANW